MPKPVTQVSRSLELPDGYQRFDGMRSGVVNEYGTVLDNPAYLLDQLGVHENEPLYLYTQHQIFLDNGVIKQTRSSPNWEGGLVTYATCKHLMRTYQRDTWKGVWIGGLCPAQCANNCLLFVGRVCHQFSSNFALGQYVREYHPTIARIKQACANPRGDLYKPLEGLIAPGQVYDHRFFYEPLNHTRSVEFYGKSPGSKSNRPDGKIPKWWRDLEYLHRERRPVSFILSPCWVFSEPTLWTSYQPRRAVLKLTAGDLRASARKNPAGLGRG